MLNFLSNRIQKSIKKMSVKTTLTDDNIKDVIREIKFSLLEADVNLLVVKKFIKSIKEKAIGADVTSSLDASQEMVKIVKNELTKILGSNAKEIVVKKPPLIALMVGLQGTGKTTSAAKICAYLRKKKKIKKPLMIAADVYRPAAIKQLVTLGKQIQVETYELGNKKDPREIVKEGIKYARNNEFDFVIIDTAGRLSVDEKLMKEIVDIKKIARPSEIFLTIDALAGQEVINVAKTFHESLNLTGTIVTKLDSDARGGASLSIASLLKIPIQFIGTGEAINNLDLFYPDRMAKRILGMGDILSLIEKSSEVLDEQKSKKMVNRLMGGRFDLDDLLEQLKQMKKMGKFSKIIALMPGLKKVSAEQIKSAENKFKLFEILISSMTIEERKNPKLLKNSDRKKRIINGSGRSNQEYNKLVNEFEKMKQQMKLLSKSMSNGTFDPRSIMGGM